MKELTVKEGREYAERYPCGTAGSNMCGVEFGQLGLLKDKVTEQYVGYTCTRENGHDGPHVAHETRDTAMASSEMSHCGMSDPKRRAWCVLNPDHKGKHQDSWGKKFTV